MNVIYRTMLFAAVIGAIALATINRTSAQNSNEYWYYCPSARAYYPYVQTCTEQWQRVLSWDRAARSEVPNTPSPRARETAATDRAWEHDDEHGACSRLHDRSTDAKADIAACERHYASMPPCWDYHKFAEMWFDLRQHDPQTFGNQSQMLDSIGTGPGDRPIAIYHNPTYVQQLRRLLTAVTTLNLSTWTKSKFAAYAYRRCLSGNPL
jgi:hypothetical protein